MFFSSVCSSAAWSRFSVLSSAGRSSVPASSPRDAAFSPEKPECRTDDSTPFIWQTKHPTTRMWADAQRDGRPAEYRWRPLFNATLECRAVTLPRRETRWNLQGCPKLPNQSQVLVGRSSPYYEDMWRRCCSLTIFFRLSINALVAMIQPNKILWWCRDGDFFLCHFCVLYFQQATCSTF